MKMVSALLVLSAIVCAPAPAASQDTISAGWDGDRALELIRRAQERRTESARDTGLTSYRADATGLVYFYLDRGDAAERNLVKTDQLALEVLWEAPDRTKQRIIGWRDRRSLPTNINYHLDHLSVVQENFGDEIRIGDGDEVRGVVHPAAPLATRFYHYRLTDSLTLRLPGADEPVRVYQLDVVPRNTDRPGFIGEIFLDRARGDLVRMDFTFTAAAYVDNYLDYINISLDNGLWEGRYWLPNRQRVELRRRIPHLDIPAGTVIRGDMRISGYELNVDFPQGTFAGPPVVTLPEAQREMYPFEDDIESVVREEGLGAETELGEIRRQARRLAWDSALRSGGPVRLRLRSVSELIRYNRAEGLAMGAGATLALPGGRMGILGGYAFGAEHPIAELALESGGATSVRAALFVNRARDVGVGPATSGFANTLAAVLAGRDYQDLFYATGAEITLRQAMGDRWSAAVTATAELQESAERTVGSGLLGGEFRPVRGIDSDAGGHTARAYAAALKVERLAPAGAARWWNGRVDIRGGTQNPFGVIEGSGCFECRQVEQVFFVKPEARFSAGRPFTPRDGRLEVEVRAGAAFGEITRQELYLLGGRGTVPGYEFRAYGGDRYALARATGSWELWRPWARGRLLAAAGLAHAGASGAEALNAWPASPTNGVKTSIGAGLGLIYDVLHVDVARGLGSGGGWEVIVEANRTFRDIL
jgi:hypothetical protein